MCSYPCRKHISDKLQRDEANRNSEDNRAGETVEWKKEHQERSKRGNRCTGRKRKYKWEGKAIVEGESSPDQFERTKQKLQNRWVKTNENYREEGKVGKIIITLQKPRPITAVLLNDRAVWVFDRWDQVTWVKVEKYEKQGKIGNRSSLADLSGKWNILQTP